jgi:hypothetical protein
MIIEKNGKTYTVRENLKSWSILINYGSIPVTFNVKKTDCASFEELKQFIIENSAF